MFTTIGTLILIVSMLLGGGGITVAAAQNSLPDDTLYPVKIWSEEVRASLAPDETAQLDLQLEFANRRTEEIQAMVQAGKVPTDKMEERLENQVDGALELAAGQENDEQAQQELAQLWEHLQAQSEHMLQVRDTASPNAAPALTKVYDMFQARLAWAELGVKNPAQLREILGVKPGNGHPGGSSSEGTSTPETNPTEISATPEENSTVEVTPSPEGTRPGKDKENKEKYGKDGTPEPGKGNGNNNGGFPWFAPTPTPGDSQSGSVVEPTSTSNNDKPGNGKDKNGLPNGDKSNKGGSH